MTMSESANVPALRRCPYCAKSEAIGRGDQLWPFGWRCSSCGGTLHFVDGIAMVAPQSDATQINMNADAFDGLVGPCPRIPHGGGRPITSAMQPHGGTRGHGSNKAVGLMADPGHATAKTGSNNPDSPPEAG